MKPEEMTTDTPKLSLSRMESQLAKVSRESTTVQKDEWEQLLSWAKRIRETGLAHVREMRREFGAAVDEEPYEDIFREVLALEKLLSEFGE